jgi:hypothetical protein
MRVAGAASTGRVLGRICESAAGPVLLGSIVMLDMERLLDGTWTPVAAAVVCVLAANGAVVAINVLGGAGITETCKNGIHSQEKKTKMHHPCVNSQYSSLSRPFTEHARTGVTEYFSNNIPVKFKAFQVKGKRLNQTTVEKL